MEFIKKLSSFKKNTKLQIEKREKLRTTLKFIFDLTAEYLNLLNQLFF